MKSVSICVHPWLNCQWLLGKPNRHGTRPQNTELTPPIFRRTLAPANTENWFHHELPRTRHHRRPRQTHRRWGARPPRASPAAPRSRQMARDSVARSCDASSQKVDATPSSRDKSGTPFGLAAGSGDAASPALSATGASQPREHHRRLAAHLRPAGGISFPPARHRSAGVRVCGLRQRPAASSRPGNVSGRDAP